jgi:hypothetical protein
MAETVSIASPRPRCDFVNVAANGRVGALELCTSSKRSTSACARSAKQKVPPCANALPRPHQRWACRRKCWWPGTASAAAARPRPGMRSDAHGNRKMYRVYSVITRAKQDDFWLNIGTAFPHEKGDGFRASSLAVAKRPAGDASLRPDGPQPTQAAPLAATKWGSPSAEAYIRRRFIAGLLRAEASSTAQRAISYVSVAR